jgi:D-glycero-D-manno-heptose 1,7-bisphosphate phosphatase
MFSKARNDARLPMRHPAIFFDRDDTLVVDSGFIDHPDKIQLVPGAANAIRRLKEAGFKIVVATNQSGVARGLFDEDRLRDIHDRLIDVLAAEGASIDGIYYCPYLAGPDAKVDQYRKDSPLRKPAPGMLIQAARDLEIDLLRSWMIGDGARDIEAGAAAGCRTILVERNGQVVNGSTVQPTHRTGSIERAAEIVEVASAADGTGETESVSITPDVTPDNVARSNRIAARDEVATRDEVGNPSKVAKPTTSESLLVEIRDLLDQSNRDFRHDDFSIRRLVGTLVQMAALVSAGWGLVALFSEQPAVSLGRFSLAAFLQLVVITLSLANRR